MKLPTCVGRWEALHHLHGNAMALWHVVIHAVNLIAQQIPHIREH